jgi:iron(III) transport system ATP-binding protein
MHRTKSRSKQPPHQPELRRHPGAAGRQPRIEPGEFFALLGPSGSGKSTLLRLIAGFNQHQSGELLVDGKDITGTPPHARNVGMVFQNYALWPHMTVWDNVAFGLVERRETRTPSAARWAPRWSWWAWADYASAGPTSCRAASSSAWRWRAPWSSSPSCCCWTSRCPTWTRQLRVQMREELLNLQRTLGLTTIFVTHDQEEAMTTADRMAVLDKGVVQQVGTAGGLYDYPVNRFVARLRGHDEPAAGQVRATMATLTLRRRRRGPPDAARSPDEPRGRGAALAFARTPMPPSLGDGSARSRLQWLPGTVEAAEFLGEFTRYRVRVGGGCAT